MALGEKMLYKLDYLRRLIATAISFSIFGLGGVVIALLMYPLICLFVVQEKRIKAGRLCIHYSFKFFIAMMRILGIYTFETHNIAKLNKVGSLIVANHPTLIDVVFLLSFIKDANCVVKASLAKNIFMLGPLKAAGYILKSDDPATFLHQCSDILQQGQSLIIFPEGTRSNNSGFKFQRGAANIALLAQKHFLPVTIECYPAMLQKGVKWYKIPQFRPHFKIQVFDELKINHITQDYSLESAIKVRKINQLLLDFYVQKLNHSL